jgi:hypothetical protein
MVFSPVPAARGGAQDQNPRLRALVDYRRHLPRQLRRIREHPKHRGFMLERERTPRPGLLDHVGRARASRRDENAVASGCVHDSQTILDDRTRFEKAERQEIVGDL